MRLTVSKRIEFAASHRYFRTDQSKAENFRRYGRKSEGAYGHGHNYTAYFIFDGQVDPATGMMVNISTVKERLLPLLAERYDHKYLNLDIKPFDEILPTPENVARHLLIDASPLFDDLTANLSAVYLEEDAQTAALARLDGITERIVRLDFSAARRTYSPHLSDDENRQLFGIASDPGGHGHHYYLDVVFSGDPDKNDGFVVPEREYAEALADIHSEFDHRNLNSDIPILEGKPMTTETIAQYLGDRISGPFPVRKLRLSENDRFAIEYYPRGQRHSVTVRDHFYAAHRLHSERLDDTTNRELYGKCNNPGGHGHEYRVEAAFGGKLDEKSGILYNLAELSELLRKVKEVYNYRHLDLECEDFSGRPSTGENIVGSFWERLSQNARFDLERLRLWETNNNRFTLRRL